MNRSKKIKIFTPIKEEIASSSVDYNQYKGIFKKCHADLKNMKIGLESQGEYYKSTAKLVSVVLKIREIKS